MTAKGRRHRLKGEDEFDVVDSTWRRVTGWARVVARIKRRMNKRGRREAREALRKEL